MKTFEKMTGAAEELTPEMHNSILEAALRALAEDHARHDVTTTATGLKSVNVKARIISKGTGILSGLPVAYEVFHCLGPRIMFKPLMRDGNRLRPGRAVCSISGPAGSILAGERVALNFLQRLSGISTLTEKFVSAAAAGGGANGITPKILSTRKTAPGLRALEKYAVRVGGGAAHRMDLSEAALIKDNHIRLLKTRRVPLERAIDCVRRTYRGIVVAAEAQTLSDVAELIRCSPDIILLDNMRPPVIRRAVGMIRRANARTVGKIQVEVSGGVNLSNIKAMARLGADRISIGALTHSASAVDMSMEIC